MKDHLLSTYIGIQIFMIVLLFGLMDVVNAQDQIRVPEGELERTSPGDIWPNTLSGNTYNEFWTYYFELNEDIKITMIFSVANFGSLKSPVSGVRMSVVGFGDRTYQIMREYPLSRLVADRETWMFRLHPERDIWFEGRLPDRHVVNFSTGKDGVSYDIRLELTEIQHGYKWGDGKFRIDGSDAGMVTHIPYASVTGHVRINEREEKVHGTAYMDQAYQDQITTRLLSDGFNYIYQNGPDDWGAGHFLAAGQNVIGYSIRNRNGEVVLSKPSKIVRSDTERVFGYNLPKQVRIEFADNRHETVIRSRDRERFALLQELGGLARRLARTFLRGEVIEFRGEASIEGDNYSNPVFYNYFIVD